MSIEQRAHDLAILYVSKAYDTVVKYSKEPEINFDIYAEYKKAFDILCEAIANDLK